MAILSQMGHVSCLVSITNNKTHVHFNGRVSTAAALAAKELGNKLRGRTVAEKEGTVAERNELKLIIRKKLQELWSNYSLFSFTHVRSDSYQ